MDELMRMWGWEGTDRRGSSFGHVKGEILLDFHVKMLSRQSGVGGQV